MADAIGPVSGTVGPVAGTVATVAGTVCLVAGAMGTVAWAVGHVHVTLSPLDGAVGNVRYLGKYRYIVHCSSAE